MSELQAAELLEQVALLVAWVRACAFGASVLIGMEMWGCFVRGCKARSLF